MDEIFVDEQFDVTENAPPEDGPLGVRKLLAKARALATDVEESAALQAITTEENSWKAKNAELAPYDPASLLSYVTVTPHITPCIKSIAHNVDGHGYKSVARETWMEGPDDAAISAIVEALIVEQEYAAEEEELLFSQQEEELEQKIAELEFKGANDRTIRRHKKRATLLRQSRQARKQVDPSEFESRAAEILTEIKSRLRYERAVFKAWFEHCCSSMPFVDLRKAVRADIETHGWGTIEWLRDRIGRLKRLQYVPAYTVRPLANHGDFIAVEEDDSITPVSEKRTVVVMRQFPIFVQQVGGNTRYFKSPKDPRIVSRETGNVYETVEAMRADPGAENPGEGPDATPANELMWISKHNPSTMCSPPDWIGNLLAVLGGREADETNYFYLRDNCVPNALLFVHGGSVPAATKERLEHRLAHEVKGSENSGKILVVEAKPGKTAPAGERSMLPSLTYQPLRESQQQDALFLEYDKRNSDRIGASFGLSPVLRGYTPSDLNRATAFAAMSQGEQQVFWPMRMSFDWMVNQLIMPELGMRFLRFQSMGPKTTSAEEVGAFISAAAPHGAFVPEELRAIAGDVLNREMKKIEEDWTQVPLQLTLNGLAPGSPPTAVQTGETNARLMRIESQVGEIVRQELAASGVDYDVTVRSIDAGR